MNSTAPTGPRTLNSPRPAPGRRRFLPIAIALSCLMLMAALNAQTASVASAYPAYFAGEDISIHFAAGPGNTKDWIGIYPEEVVPGSVPSTLWFYVDGTRTGSRGLKEGTIPFPGGLNLAGTWHAFLLLNDGYTILAETKFDVVDPATTLVRTDRSVYAPNETITVMFTNGLANPKDWIGIYPASITPGASPSTLWFYVDGTRNGATGTADGQITFQGGLVNTGDYVVYLLMNDGYDVLASQPFTVVQLQTAAPRILSFEPADGASNLPPSVAISATLTNGTTQVAIDSIQLLLDGTPVAATISQSEGLTTIRYTNTILFPPNSAHTASLIFADNATPPARSTNTVSFSIANYRNITLPAPLFFENFDGVPEGQLPAGWTETSYTDTTNPDVDFANLDSAAYAKWTTVETSRLTQPLIQYSRDPSAENAFTDDYQRVLSPNPMNVVNGQVISGPLAEGRFLFGNSGYRNGVSQVLFLTSRDFNLTGKSDVHLAFHSLWEQNQDSIAAVEYSIDQGKTWKPLVYMIDNVDRIFVTNEVTGAVSLDAVATLTTEYTDVARYIDEQGQELGGTFGSFIAVPVTTDLAPYISGRVDDNPIESKRVELFRLPDADGQPNVRFRFAHAGTDSWYFGIDDFGLYSIPAVEPQPPALSITQADGKITITWPADAAGFTLDSTPSLDPAAWKPVANTSGNSVSIVPEGKAAYYRLRK